MTGQHHSWTKPVLPPPLSTPPVTLPKLCLMQAVLGVSNGQAGPRGSRTEGGSDVTRVSASKGSNSCCSLYKENGYRLIEDVEYCFGEKEWPSPLGMSCGGSLPNFEVVLRYETTSLVTGQHRKPDIDADLRVAPILIIQGPHYVLVRRILVVTYAVVGVKAVAIWTCVNPTLTATCKSALHGS